MTPKSLTIDPCSPVMGAEIKSIDLVQPVDSDSLASIRGALEEYLLVVLPEQELDARSLLTFARSFGELEVHVLSEYHMDGHPEIYLLSNVDANGETTGEHPDPGTLVWHSDLSFKEVPASFTMLYGKQVPRVGGDTLYANMYTAYEDLEETLKARIDGCSAIHDLDYSRRRAGAYGMSEKQRTEAPPVTHPLVRRHPGTGRSSLYVGHHCSKIKGCSESEGRQLLEILMDHATTDRYVYRHQWTAGDLVVWDNRCTLHCATSFDATTERRVMYRAVVKGEKLIPASV